ncbi:MAG: hypothetical protein JO031_09895 [Ktedonobacteraceae bacterium]|nr:hypothetical protein [Ktedonobacteraceae bacterium]
MSLVVKRPSEQSQNTDQRPLRRIWRTPASKAKWFWLVGSILLYGAIYLWFYQASNAQGVAAPGNDPFRFFGILAYILVLSTAAYSLRRRFVRSLPGKVQYWLWMHTWLGVITILIALLHENYAFVTNNFATKLTDLTDTYWAGLALFSLIFLVISGITGRLLDLWQTHVIARDANTNGVGIVRAVEEHILELEFTVERLCAGKSDLFKKYCMQALASGSIQRKFPAIPLSERADFQRAHETLVTRAELLQSRQRQLRARMLMRVWRYIHISLACIALLIISYHGVMELLTNVFHIIAVQ